VARLPDEAIGLPSALLGAGTAAVLGTLWPVDNLSTALLLSLYYACLLVPAGKRRSRRRRCVPPNRGWRA
jgi:hypothetical protein